MILEGEAEYAEVEPWQDETGRGGLAVAAKPVVWSGRLAKVAVVAVSYADRSVAATPGGAGKKAAAGDGGSYIDNGIRGASDVHRDLG